jgi:hypothetical protein
MFQKDEMFYYGFLHRVQVCHWKIMTQFIEMIRKNSHRRDEPWKRIIDPFHEDDEEFSREQRDVEIEQNEVFKRYDTISKEIRTIGKGKPQMLHLDVSMEIATKYNLYVLIGNMSEEDNYVLIVGNKRVTLKPFDAIIMNASVYHAGSGDAHASRMYLLYSYSSLTQKQITEIKKSAEDLWYLPTGADTPEYAGNCTDDTKVESNELCSRGSLIAISDDGACSSTEFKNDKALKTPHGVVRAVATVKEKVVFSELKLAAKTERKSGGSKQKEGNTWYILDSPFIVVIDFL